MTAMDFNTAFAANRKLTLIKRETSAKGTSTVKKHVIERDEPATFEAAVAKYQADGFNRHAAFKAAARAHPGLLAKFNGTDDLAKNDVDDAILAKHREGRALDNQIQVAAAGIAKAQGLSMTDALGVLRRQQPQLFA